ncbi:MAG: class I SAM-dependent methyltransferase [Anaerolineae bacterium]|nr:class I SAM-dependent methyltransferase [Anaerolineae bacterium]
MDTYEVKTYTSGMSWTGLAATIWDPSGGDSEQPDQAYIQNLLTANPGPALDVGCGTGRLLLRYLAAGFDVDGIDTSADMLRICQEKAAAQGLKPVLLQQAMQELDLARQYRVIYVPCGTFCLIIDRDDAQEALRRMYTHLLPGGLLVFNLFWPYKESEPLSAEEQVEGGVWHPMWTNTLPDGREVVQSFKRLRVDRIEQVMNAHRRYQLVQAGQIVHEEIFASDERWYYKHEVVLMLEKAGFSRVQVTADWTDQPAVEPPPDSIVFMAHRD